MLRKIVEVPGVARVLFSGDARLQNANYRYWVFDRYGPSLKLCFQFMSCTFTLATVCVIAIQMLNLLEKLHGQLIVHRNLKPKKILTMQLAAQQKNELVLIDFKRAVKYKHKNGKFTNQRFSSQPASVSKFTSISQHLGLAPSPKDDLESLGLMIIYFLKRGDMFKLKEEPGPKLKKMEEIKLRMIPEKFCKDLPLEILQYFQYVRNSNVGQYPLTDYEFLKKMFRSVLVQLNVTEKEFQYDWIKRMSQGKPDTKITVLEPQRLDRISEDQNEQDTLKNKFYKQISSIQFSSDEDEETETRSVCQKMSELPSMCGIIKLKS